MFCFMFLMTDLSTTKLEFHELHPSLCLCGLYLEGDAAQCVCLPRKTINEKHNSGIKGKEVPYLISKWQYHTHKHTNTNRDKNCILIILHKPHPYSELEPKWKEKHCSMPKTDIPPNHVCIHKSTAHQDAKTIWAPQPCKQAFFCDSCALIMKQKQHCTSVFSSLSCKENP